MKFCFCILHFKNSELTNRCLESVVAALDENCFAVVVDATHDYAPSEHLTLEKERILVVPTLSVNPGFSRAMNYGAAQAEGHFTIDVFVFVNNDTIIPPDFARKTALAFNCSTNVHAVGPKIVFLEDPSLVWSAGGEISHFKMCANQINSRRKSSDISGRFETRFLSGCVISVKKNSFHEVGGWPDQYLFGGEEWELSDRLLSLGGKLFVDAETIVRHEASVLEGHGKSHSFESLDFVINGYLNRKIYARNTVSKFWYKMFVFRLFIYIKFLMPVKWESVSGNKSLNDKIKICSELSRFIYSWEEGCVKSFSELAEYSSRILKKSGIEK
jgi:GT2 family glycosyltransferase